MGRYLVGEDPLRIVHHWQYMYRWSAFRGAAVMGALSASDIALWDIAGKHFEVPVYQLLGGRVRDRCRVYYHVFGDRRDLLVQGVRDARAAGYTAVGHLTPFLDEAHDVPYFKTHAEKIADAIEAVRLYREAAGTGVDLCIEIHRRMTPAEAVQLGRGIEQFHPYFFEDPVTPDNLDEMAYVASKINIPIATGERYSSLWEFDMALRRDAVQYVRPDVCLVGGISGTKKVAALAEARHVGVVPHNPLSPVSTAACLQVAAAIPNFALQELPLGEEFPPKSDIVEGVHPHDGEGYIRLTDRPGIGVSIKPDAAETAPYVAREIDTRLGRDGAVVDQ
jgi:galactonate dehydratase